ncbi:MAG TPA: copper resistance protein CopC [Nitrososphaeraceae archaeon]
MALLGFGAIHTSFGHAFVINSNPSQSQSIPKSPQQVNVFFSEPVDLRFSHLKVLDSNGKQVDKGDVHHLQNDESSLTVSLPLLKDGTYTVSTNVLSQTDGHVTDNAFVFGIGEAVVVPTNVSPSTTSSTLYLPEAISRFPTLLAQVMIVGAAFGTLWLWRPLSKITLLTDSISKIRPKVGKSLAGYYVVASIILVSSNFAIIFFQAIAIHGSIIDVFETRFGTVLIERSVISFIILGLSLFELRQFRKNKSYSMSAMENAGFLIIGMILLVTTSLIGHGASHKQLVPIIIDFVHNLVASIWIGGTFYLAFILIPKLKVSAMNWYYKLGTISVWIPRHSALVVTLLGAIFITGPFLLYILQDNLALVIGSLYGTFLIAKLTFAGLMVILGGYSSIFIQKQVVNSLKLGHVIASKSSDSSASNEQSNNETKANSIVGKFRQALVIESILGIGLLLSVGLLVNTGVPESQGQNQAQATTNVAIQNVPYEATRFLDNGSEVDLAITPFDVGNNNFKVSFLDMNGGPIDMASAQLKYTQIEQSIGPITVDLNKQSRGIYSVNASFGIPGTWNMEVQGIPAKQNMSGIVGSFDNLIVKPNFDQLKFNVSEYPISNTTLRPFSNTTIQPLYPIYDKSRNYIWFGDTMLGSGRIFAYDINNQNYVEHKINGTYIVTLMALDSKNNLWYVDPLTKTIGSYDPTNNISKLYRIPKNVTPSGMAIDSNDTIWITSPLTGEVMRFDPQVGNFTLKLHPKEQNARPFAIASDPVSNLIWFTDEAGKLAKIDPSANYSITEYSPSGNKSLSSPTALLIDKTTGEIYVSQHDGHRITVFDPLTKTFTDLPIINEAGLPFGMAIDKYGNLWVAQHTINKLAVMDTQKSKIREVPVKAPAPFIQWITSDSNGNIWFAEQRGNSIGMVEPSAGPAVQQQVQQSTKSSTSSTTSNFKLDINYLNFIAPAILVGIIISAFMYARSIVDLKSNISIVKNHR